MTNAHGLPGTPANRLPDPTTSGVIARRITEARRGLNSTNVRITKVRARIGWPSAAAGVSLRETWFFVRQIRRQSKEQRTYCGNGMCKPLRISKIALL